MPTAAPRPCTHPGCSVLVRDGSGRCDKHKRTEAKELDRRRGSSNARGYGYKWQQAREDFLREHPLCKRHEDKGQLVPSSIVDHVIPHKGDMSLFWRRSNWQALCKPCHDLKTATQDSGFARKGPRG